MGNNNEASCFSSSLPGNVCPTSRNLRCRIILRRTVLAGIWASAGLYSRIGLPGRRCVLAISTADRVVLGCVNFYDFSLFRTPRRSKPDCCAGIWSSNQSTGTEQQILSDLSRSWADDNGNSFDASCDAYDANPVTATQVLASDMPLLVCSLGHAMVLTALTYVSDPTSPIGATVTAATVRDPWPGNGGKRMLSPQEWYNISLLARVRIT